MLSVSRAHEHNGFTVSPKMSFKIDLFYNIKPGKNMDYDRSLRFVVLVHSDT